ncbi:MAG: LysR family transcriptional regulator [Actinobacteria bacterium]|nr:LysR family transcriptional regulator [Actinomycetota bacterium]
MELRHLRYFVAVAEELHVGRAAARLHIVQPALSRQIAALERELEVKLFDRTGGRITVTAAGAALLEEAQVILRRVDGAVAQTKAIARGEHGSLEIGFVGPAMWSVLPAILRGYRAAFPEVRFHIYETGVAQQVRQLREGSLDIGFLRPSGFDETIATETVWREHFMIAVPEDHWITHYDEVDLAALADEPFVMIRRADAPAFHDRFLEVCQSYGFTPKLVEEAASMSALNLVSAGIGVSLIPDSVAGRPWPGLAFRPLTRPGREIELAAAYLRDNESPTVQAFLEVARNVTPRAFGGGQLEGFVS